jgi:hypothetical protein
MEIATFAIRAAARQEENVGPSKVHIDYLNVI